MLSRLIDGSLDISVKKRQQRQVLGINTYSCGGHQVMHWPSLWLQPRSLLIAGFLLQ
jgi:hypothetical protein